MTRRHAALLALAALLAGHGLAHARPGGGSSFSGRSSSSSSSYRPASSYRPSSSSSSSSSSSYSPPKPPPKPLDRLPPDASSRRWTWAPGDPPRLFGDPPPPPADRPVRERCGTIFEYDEVFDWSRWLETYGPVPALLLLVVVPIVHYRRRRATPGWSTQADAPARPAARRRLEQLRAGDPDFSVVLFEDFLAHLYTAAHTARGTGDLATSLRAYVRPAAREALLALGTDPVSAIIVGALEIRDVARHDGRWLVVVGFTTNYSETSPSGLARGYYSEEVWTLSRAEHARSRPPERVQALGCPSCGAPASALLGATCDRCNQPVDAGNFDWIVESVHVAHREQRPPVLTGTSVEVGTDRATLRDLESADHYQQLLARTHTTDAAFQARLAAIFESMQQAWSTLQWADARPYLSDALHRAQTYWIAAYRAAGLRNDTRGATLERSEVVRVTSDRWYDAVTVRIFASGPDVTVRVSDDTIVAGSKTPRRYSEYWTLIRSADPDRSDALCPNCGALLTLTMAGDCDHCGSHLTTPARDWVLSRIEQDEVYAG